MNKIKIIPARAEDCAEILSFIRALAVYEKLEHEVVATCEILRENLFTKRQAAEVVFAEVESRRVGIAIFFPSFSTFLGQPGIYLEDLFVLPEMRGQGVGKALLAHMARLTIARRCGRLEWSVLDWNTPAQELYKSIGAEMMDGWTVHRLTGPALQKLAEA